MQKVGFVLEEFLLGIERIRLIPGKEVEGRGRRCNAEQAAQGRELRFESPDENPDAITVLFIFADLPAVIGDRIDVSPLLKIEYVETETSGGNVRADLISCLVRTYVDSESPWCFRVAKKARAKSSPIRAPHWPWSLRKPFGSGKNLRSRASTL
jgi:hypothetical protein